MLPKSLLIPKLEEAGSSNFALAKSIGGREFTLLECKEATDSAEHVAFCNNDPMYPGSAFTSSELYGKEIDDVTVIVPRELFPKHPRKLVIFAVGTAPGHDYFEICKQVESAMNTPGIVYKAELVWKVVTVVSRAEVILSTSLHV